MTLASEHQIARRRPCPRRELANPLVRRLRPYRRRSSPRCPRWRPRPDRINLGQGFPDTDGPASLLEAARRAIADGVNQYPPGPGIPALRQAIARAGCAITASVSTRTPRCW